MSTVADFRRAMRENSTQSRVFDLLDDEEWHCRECEGKGVASGQYAGGGGIQGLQRGTQSRPGLVIVQEKRYCAGCGRSTLHDRWTGEFKAANAATSLSAALQRRILETFARTDVIELRQRPAQELIIDHKFPMLRWGSAEPANPAHMAEADIRAKFQLLKKDDSGNHNLLKSRACETCLRTGRRGAPFDIKFWYQGDAWWPADAPEEGPAAERGCVGCGWYDFQAWRAALNAAVARTG